MNTLEKIGQTSYLLNLTSCAVPGLNILSGASLLIHKAAGNVFKNNDYLKPFIEETKDQPTSDILKMMIPFYMTIELIKDCKNDTVEKNDPIYDIIPIFSTLNSLINLIQKFAIKFFLSPETIANSRRLSYLQDKSVKDCLIPLVPFIGNAIYAWQNA